MSDTRQEDQQQPQHDEESTGHAGLDARLSEGVVDFHRGIDAAQVYVSAFLIVAAGVLLYTGALGAPFQGRDYPLFVDNPPMHQVATLSEALSTLPEAPVTVLDLALNASMTGLAPFGFHLFSLLMHLGCGLLLYAIARRLFGRGQPEPVAMAAGLLLIVHPAAVQNVLYLSGRAELHASLFALAALWFFLRATPSVSETRPLPVALAFVCYGIAAGSSPVAIGLPIIVLWADVVRYGAGALRARWMLHGAAFLALPLVLTAILAGMPAVEPGGLSLPGKTALALQQMLYAVATGGELAPVYDGIPSSVPGGAWMVTLALVLAALALLAARSAATLIPLWLLAVATGAAAIAGPESWTAPHGAYFALAGAALVLPWGISLFEAPGIRAGLGVAIAALIVAAGVSSYQRSIAWTSPEILWNRMAESHPDAAAPREYLGRLAETRGRSAENPEQARLALQEALAYYEEAADRAPKDLTLARIIARLTLELGRVPLAIARLDALAPRMPFDGEAARLQARAHDLALRFAAMDALPEFAESTGAPEEVINRIRMALAQQPADPRAVTEAASYLARTLRHANLAGQARVAAEAYARAETLDTLEPGDRLAWALVLYALDNVPRASEVMAGIEAPNVVQLASDFKTHMQNRMAVATQRESQSAELISDPKRQMEALQLRAQALLLRGEHLAAAYLLESLVSRDETRDAAWQELGALRGQQGQTALFLEQHGDALPGGSPLWKALAMRCVALGNWEAARTYLAAPQAALTPLDQEMTLGETVLALGLLDRAEKSLRETAAAHPEAPQPWLRLADVALARKNTADAVRLLAEAEKRGAEAAELEKRRAIIREGGVDPNVVPEEDEAVRTIIR